MNTSIAFIKTSLKRRLEQVVVRDKHVLFRSLSQSKTAPNSLKNVKKVYVRAHWFWAGCSADSCHDRDRDICV